jgi:hypothetical protein
VFKFYFVPAKSPRHVVRGSEEFFSVFQKVRHPNAVVLATSLVDEKQQSDNILGT